MKSHIRHILFLLGLFVGSVLSADAAVAAGSLLLPEASSALPMPVAETGIVISVRGNQVRVQNAEGLTLDVYNVAGVKVGTYRIDSEDKTVTLNVERGIYIVKVGKVARRVNIL